MIRQNKTQAQKIIMFSKEISALPSSLQTNNELIIQDEDAVYPRVFPNPKIPLKVAIMRKLKAYQQYQIDSILKEVDWKYNKGLLQLRHYNFLVDDILHECTEQRLSKGAIKGRALDSKSMCFKQFIVNKITKEEVLIGYFVDNPKEQIQINKFYICLSFQNPQKYAKIILQSLQNRQNFLSMARFSFYIDNMDLQQAPELPKSILNAVTSMIGVQFLNRDLYKQVSNHYRRTMNEILFQHSVLNGGIDNIFPIIFRQRRKLKGYTPKTKAITLMKDGKKFKLTFKSLKKKIQQIQTKTIFFKDQIISLTHSIKSKILSIYNYQIFDLKEELFVLDRFIADNMLMVGYFLHFVDEKVIGHIADMIRKELVDQPQGWFKVYDGDRNSYLLTKLRRFFIFVQQNIKSVVKTHIQAEVLRYSQVLRKRLPINIKFNSFRKFKLQFEHTKRKDVTYSSLIIISSNIGVNNFQMTIKRDKIQQNLLKNLKSIFKKIQKINSPQNKALRQIYAMFKDQFGIQIQLPIQQINIRQSASILINQYENTWISTEYTELKRLISQSIQTLKVIEDKLREISIQINLKQILAQDHFNPNMSEVIAKIDHFQALYLRIDDYFPGLGVDYGLFFIDYKPAKDQLKELLQRKISNNKSFIMSEYRANSQRIETQLENLLNQINQKPGNIYELVKQREKLAVLQNTVEGFNQRYEKYLYSLCEDYSCFFSKEDNERRWTNTKKISDAFEARKIKGKQYNEIKKGIVLTISKQKQEIEDILNLFQITLDNIRLSANRTLFQQNFHKLQHLNGQYLSVKKMIQYIRYKQQHLILPAQDFQLFQKIQEPFLLLHTLWDVVCKWEMNRQIWYHRPFSEFQINKPELIIHEMLNSIKKIEKKIKQNFSSELFTLIFTVKTQIQFFQKTHLRLLKLLKKQGFSKKHLQKIGLYIKCQLDDLSLQSALDLNFLQAIEQIQAVSNEAWNEFYLQQTLTRVQSQLSQMKYEIIYYLDKKGNQIPLIDNYSSLDEKIEQIILDLQSVQFNPMKGNFQNRINQLLEKSIYITRSLQKCEIFQKKFVQLHPIFDSTDVVKQLPVENRLFTKLLRSWVQLLKYFKKIVSVYDSCNGQNIAQKMSFMITNIENVKVGLANYLQRKRQGFNRFYLLTDQQLYQLFASTNDMKVLSMHISKLFHSITDLSFDDEYIYSVIGINTSLKLKNKVLYKKQNLQQWLNLLERSIKQTLFYHFQILMGSKNKWINLLNYECSQILLMCYEIEKTQQILSMQDLKKTQQSQRFFIRKLVDVKNNRLLSIGQSINLGSLLVLALYLSQKVGFLRANNISDVDNFQIKKMMKIIFKDEQISIISFQTKIGYGFEYLGLVKRLVLTNLTERMQLIYMLAIKYSLGGSAIGPAGTGKSETTKDIARICGKNCIIYNCSQSLTIDTIIRILKGMVVTGLWVCLDQFNRLHYQVLNMISEQLSIIFKYKAMGVKLQVEYDRQVINFKPDYHLCIAYNPTYVDRQVIPNHVLKQFRIVALVKCDKKMICKLLFYSKGFKEADSLSEKLNKIFDYCEHLWSDYHLYDFGLRTLISIIELSGMTFKGTGKGDSEVNEAIKILVFPRLSEHHKKILSAYSKEVFQQYNFERMENSLASKANQISNILSVRLGIIILGDIFSNKTSTIKYFQNSYKDFKIEQIHINTLTIDQIYGQTNKTTRIFKDGYLTKKIREYLSSKMQKKLLIYIKGVIFSQWIENLNSVLDNTRSLSLPSGEILWIPETIKFVLNTSHLDYASPATISRSCVMSYRSKTAKELLRFGEGQQVLRDKSYDKFEELYKKLKVHMLYDVEDRLIVHWINRFLIKGKLELCREAFVHGLSLIYEGLLDEAGRVMFDQAIKIYVQINQSIFDVYWDGKIWKNINEFCKSNIPNKINDALPSTIIIKNQKYNKIYFINKAYFMGKGSLQDIMLLIGHQNIGKSSITSFIYSQLDKKLVQFKRINLTQRIESEQLHSQLVSMLHKKSNKRKGMIHVKEMFVLLDDIHLPQKNRYQFTDILEFINLMVSKKGCYNYGNLEFQFIDQIYLIANNNLSKKRLNVGNQFLKHSLPIFVKQYKDQEIQYIFAQIIKQYVSVQLQRSYYTSISNKLVSFIPILRQEINAKIPKYFQFQFFHLHKILLNSLTWNTSQMSDKKITIDQIIIFELQRIILSRIHNLEEIQNIKGLIRKHFVKELNLENLFHSFQKGQNGTSIIAGNCKHVGDFQDFLRQIQCICDQYVLASQHPQSSLVVFPELCILLCRITRGLSINQGHISLVGLPKCGKKMIVNLCNYLLRSKIYRIPQKYDQKLWYQSIRMCSKQSLQNKCPSILLIQQHQLKHNTQKQQLNSLLKSTLLQQVFTQADYQQLIYLFQNQLIRRHLAVNKQNTLQLFKNYLNTNLHIVLLMNPMLKDFKENMITYPAISKYCQFYWIVDWPSEALVMIAQQAVVENQLEPFLRVFPELHQASKRKSMSATKIPHWEGLYLDFLKIFQKIYSENNHDLVHQQSIFRKSFAIIKQTELKLEATRDQIKRLQPAILILQKQTIKTIKSLNIQKANAETVNEQLVKKQTECSRVIGQANAVKIKLQITNKRVEQELKKAWENVYLVKQTHISEIKSLMNPSEFIKIVITAIVIIMNEGQFQIIRNRSEDGLSYEQSYFQTGKRYILSKDSKVITKMLTQYNKQKLNKQKITLIQEKCLKHPRWNIIQAKSANKAIFYFFLWVEAVVQYFKLYQQTIPMRQQLTKATLLFQQKSKEVEIVKKQLGVYQRKIKQLTQTHKQKTQKLTEYTNQIKLYQKMLNRGYEILKQIQTQKSKWTQYQNQIQQKFKQNFGNSIMSSFMITYASPHTKQVRNSLVQQAVNIIANYSIQINNERIYWLMKNQQEIILKQMGIYEDEYILNNLKIVEKTEKMCFMIDPQEEGFKYIKMRYKNKGVMFIQKIDYHHKMFRKTLERAVIDGLVIFIQITGDSLPYLIEFLLNPKLHKNESNGNIELIFDQKFLPLHPSFKAFLFTTSSTNLFQKFSIDLISKVTTVNFSITGQQLQQKLIDIAISIQYPQQNEQLEEINKINIKDNIQLSSIENKILAIFANMQNPQDILKTEEILQILSTSNRLYKQIQTRIEQSNSKRKILRARRQHFTKKAEKTSRLYFQLQKMSILSIYYRYSFNWFINLFKESVNNFTDNLWRELSKALPGELKIIAPLLIAQTEFPKIPFWKLFNQKAEQTDHILDRYRLKVSQMRLGKIVENIRLSEIDLLDRMVKDYPEKFQILLRANQQDILSGIPDEFSELQFFDKILLVNCFRPDCTLQLLGEWFNLNLGVQLKSDSSKLLVNIPHDRPILVLEGSHSSSPIFISKLFDSLYRQTGRALCYINCNNCSLARIQLLLQSGFENDQWVVMEGLGENSAEINELVIAMMQEGDFKRKDIFRLWMVVSEVELSSLRQKLVKLSTKIVFQQGGQLLKKVSNAFTERVDQIGDVQISKKKYMLHQLCLLHYMLSQKSKYGQKMWNTPIIFSHDDLIVSTKYLKLSSPQQLKKLYPSILTDIVYGGKITDQVDVETISLHAQQCINGLIIDKGAFWQTVWADEKFPKSQQQYEAYLRTIISKPLPFFKNLHEQYGINTFVVNFTRQNQYQRINRFYNNALLDANNQSVHSRLVPLLQSYQLSLVKSKQFLGNALPPNSNNPFYSFLIDEQETYHTRMKSILQEINNYLALEDISESQMKWALSIIADQIPNSWQISSIRTFSSWLAVFQQGYREQQGICNDDWGLSQSEVSVRALTRIYQLQLIHHFPSFCQQLFQIAKGKTETHYLCWEPIRNERQLDGGIKVQRWYLWNASFSDELCKPLQQGTMQLNYYFSLPRGYLTVVSRQKISLLSQFQPLPIYKNSIQYGNNPTPLLWVHLPIQKLGDRTWTKRFRSHLTLYL